MLIVMLIALCTLYKKIKYDKSEYKKESGNSYLKTITNTGIFGEYETFCKLQNIKGKYKILTNVYVPKENDETTEIDLVYIHETGIYVLESKNYSGWIFGDESNKNWTQSFKNGHKERFYNPIKQNNAHINYLKKLLECDMKIFKSIIVFSERCTLKKINIISENVYVINRYNLLKTIKKIISNSSTIFSHEEINSIYNKLKPYTCVSDLKKQEHIRQIEDKLNNEKRETYSNEINTENKNDISTIASVNDLSEERFLSKEENDITNKKQVNLYSDNGESFVVKRIKEKLDLCKGKANIKLFRGDTCEISYDSEGKGLVSPKIPPKDQLIWAAFDAAVEIVINNGGKAEKGSARSKGARLGNEKLPLNSVEGYIAYKVHGAKEGDSAFGPGFVICAVLDWAGICKNERGFLSINPEFLSEIKAKVS